jgi:hypothetical protein
MPISYCRNCGKELIGEPYYCMNCGARPSMGKSYCPACAAPTTPLSEICVKCGTCLIPIASIAAAGKSRTGKYRSTAIILAVIMHLLTWLYTYQKDSWKFWVAFGIWMFMLMTLAAHIGPWGWMMALAVWIWAIIDTALKTDNWYLNYQERNRM